MDGNSLLACNLSTQPLPLAAAVTVHLSGSAFAELGQPVAAYPAKALEHRFIVQL